MLLAVAVAADRGGDPQASAAETSLQTSPRSIGHLDAGAGGRQEDRVPRLRVQPFLDLGSNLAQLPGSYVALDVRAVPGVELTNARGRSRKRCDVLRKPGGHRGVRVGEAARYVPIRRARRIGTTGKHRPHVARGAEHEGARAQKGIVEVRRKNESGGFGEDVWARRLQNHAFSMRGRSTARPNWVVVPTSGGA